MNFLTSNDLYDNDVNLRTQSSILHVLTLISDQLTRDDANSDVMSYGVLRTGQASFLVYLCSLLHCLFETGWCNYHGVCMLFCPYLSCQCPAFQTTPRHSRHVLEVIHTRRIPTLFLKLPNCTFSLIWYTCIRHWSLWYWADDVNQVCLIIENVLRALQRNRLGKCSCRHLTQYGYRSWVCFILL